MAEASRHTPVDKCPSAEIERQVEFTDVVADVRICSVAYCRKDVFVRRLLIKPGSFMGSCWVMLICHGKERRRPSRGPPLKQNRPRPVSSVISSSRVLAWHRFEFLFGLFDFWKKKRKKQTGDCVWHVIRSKGNFPRFFLTYCLIWLITLICVCMCASTCMWALDQRWHCILPTSLILCSSGTSTLRPAPVFLITVVIKGTDRGARSLLTYFLTSLPTDLSAGGWTTCWRRRAPEGAAFISRAEVWGGGVEKTHLIWDGFPPVLQGFFFSFPTKYFDAK